jgi:hypothetical protein
MIAEITGVGPKAPDTPLYAHGRTLEDTFNTPKHARRGSRTMVPFVETWQRVNMIVSRSGKITRETRARLFAVGRRT